MVHSHEFDLNPIAYAEQILARSEAALRQAVAIVSPENPDEDPVVVFPNSSERRADDPGLDLTDEQEEQLRSAAAELGFGRESDRTLSEQGIVAPYLIIEGGQPHKMKAELEVALLDLEDNKPRQQPRAIILTATPFRAINMLDEKQSAKRLTGKTGANEYEQARDIVGTIPNIELSGGGVLPFSYDIDDGFKVTRRPSGQFEMLGNLGPIPVILMRIDRETLADGSYIKQPGTADIIQIIDAIARDGGETEAPIAFITSSTYEPSRSVGVATAAIHTDRLIAIGSYGTARLATVKGVDEPAPAPITQLPGELNKMAKDVKKLKQVLEQHTQSD